jgi:hypothetical protein
VSGSVDGSAGMSVAREKRTWSKMISVGTRLSEPLSSMTLGACPA